MLYITGEHGFITSHIGTAIPESTIHDAEYNRCNFVIQADGHELKRALMIVSNNMVYDEHLANKSAAKFVGDEARKIILNW